MTETKKGLSEREVVLSREKHGANKLEGKKKTSFIKSFFPIFAVNCEYILHSQ